MTQTQNALIEIVWTHITDETSATKLQAELAIEGVVLWLREQGQNDAANLIAKNLITQTETLKKKFQITDIEFDLTENCHDFDQLFGEYIDTEMLQGQLQRVYTKTLWDADDHDDLLEQISDASGRCINSIEYEEVK